MGISAQPCRSEQPVEICSDCEAYCGPADIGNAGEIRESGQTHKQVARHIARLCAHCGNERTELSAAEVEIGGRFVLPRAAEADYQHSDEVDGNRPQDTDV